MNKERIAHIAQGAIIGALLGAGIGWYMHWLEQRDHELRVWAGSYEECIQDKYHTTPTQYYWEHGEYPTCQVAEITIY